MQAPTSQRLRVLDESQVEFYRTNGYLLLESFVPADWLKRLVDASNEFVEESRSLTAADRRLDIEPDHTAENPRLRRLTSPVDHHETFAEFTLSGPVVDVALDLVGAPARYHHSKLNYKWSQGGGAVQWHQDIQYWPHSDFTPLTIGVYLADVDDEMGPMGIIPGSHTGTLFDLYDDNGDWTGRIRDEDLPSIDLEAVDWLTGPAGSITVHNCGSVHGSMPNNSGRVRPLLLQTYSAADSYPLLGVGTNGLGGGFVGNHSGRLVGGSDAPRSLTIDGRRMCAAPDWSRGGYTTIFDVQAENER